jgi:hypothetical protein
MGSQVGLICPIIYGRLMPDYDAPSFAAAFFPCRILHSMPNRHFTRNLATGLVG